MNTAATVHSPACSRGNIHQPASQADGKIVARATTALALDTTFDSDATATYDIGRLEKIQDLTIEADGTIIVA